MRRTIDRAGGSPSGASEAVVNGVSTGRPDGQGLRHGLVGEVDTKDKGSSARFP